MTREGTCPTCGQPDNCGDCTHQPLTPEQWDQLGESPADWPRPKR